MSDQCRVTFKKNHVETQIEYTTESSVLELAIEKGIEISHSCGGHGTCGTCRVFVEKSVDKLLPRNEIELEMAEDRGFSENERLSCQIHPVPGLVIKIP